MATFKQIKKRIYEEGRIVELLEKLGCHNIKPDGNGKRYSAALPDGDNSRSVQVRNNENLTVSVYTRGINNTDIFGLVSYIINGKQDDLSRKGDILNAKQWILHVLEYEAGIWIQKDEFAEAVNTFNKVTHRPPENTVLDPMILNQFVRFPWGEWIEEGISYKTQLEYGVCFDLREERVIIPWHNKHGQLIGCKGRYIGNDIDIMKSKKYNFVIPCNKSIELFNYHRALPHIKKRKEVIVFEAEKSCMKATQFDFPNSVAIGGDAVTDFQAKILEELDVNIVLAFDQDRNHKLLSAQRKTFNKDISAIYDSYGLLEAKASPVDQGVETWLELYESHQIPL